MLFLTGTGFGDSNFFPFFFMLEIVLGGIPWKQTPGQRFGCKWFVREVLPGQTG